MGGAREISAQAALGAEEVRAGLAALCPPVCVDPWLLRRALTRRAPPGATSSDLLLAAWPLAGGAMRDARAAAGRDAERLEFLGHINIDNSY